jgi:hypothetical protein
LWLLTIFAISAGRLFDRATDEIDDDYDDEANERENLNPTDNREFRTMAEIIQEEANDNSASKNI